MHNCVCMCFKERHLIKLNSLQRHIFSICAWAAIFLPRRGCPPLSTFTISNSKNQIMKERARLAEREIKKKANPGGARPVVAHRCGRSCIHGGVHGRERTALSCRRPNKPKKSEAILKLHQHDLQTSKFAAPGCTGTRLKVVTSTTLASFPRPGYM